MAQVADYNIANASGASVRSDLNSVFSAIKTLNSGGSDPTNTEAFMPYVDTADNNNLKIRNSSNNGFTTIGPVDTVNLGLLPATGGSMTGVLGLPNQTASNPSIHFGDSTTGFFRKGSNQVGLAASGTEQLFLDQNGVTLNAQNEIRFGDSDSSNYAAIKAPATISSNFTLTLPTTAGNDGEFLKVGSSGALSFATVAASSLTGNTLASGVTASSLTSVGTLSSLTVSGLSTLNETRLASIKDTSGNNSSTAEELNQGRAKAWVNFNGTGTIAIRDSFNVSSITDVSQGTTTITMASAMSNTNYVLGTAAGSTSTDGLRVLGCFNNFTTTTFTVVSSFHDNQPYAFDGEINTVAVFGD
tara:strand:+ start:1990 stop:3063 length:1074 start_codon:yes stop_codon:yes gene_type:complete